MRKIVFAFLSVVVSCLIGQGAFAEGANTDNDSTIEKISVSGNHLISTEEILSGIVTRVGDEFSRERLAYDLRTLDSMGYFNGPQLRIDSEKTSTGLKLNIVVHENPTITSFSFVGNTVFKTEMLEKYFEGQVGRPASLRDVSGSIGRIEKAYKEKGFVMAQVAEVNDTPDGRLTFVIKEGTIEKIVVTGNTKTKDYVIRNHIKVKPGDLYNEKLLTNCLKKLYANGYFSDIRRTLVPSPDGPGKYVLKVDVEERRSGSFNAGYSIDSLSGPLATTGLTENIFRGRGQVEPNGASSFMPGVMGYNVESAFVERIISGANVSNSVSGFGRNMASMAIAQSMQRTVEASTTYSKPLGLGKTGIFGLSGETSKLRDVGELYADENFLRSMAQREDVTGADSAFKAGTIDATRGSYVRLSTTPTAGVGAAFIKGGIVASKFVPLAHDTTLAMNTKADSRLVGMPQFAQYRLGGYFGKGIRGYRSFSDLGTGTHMLMGTTELRRKLNLPGDNVINRVINNRVKHTSWLDYGQVGGNNSMNVLMRLPRLGGLPSNPGDFPARAVGLRNGRPVAEYPCEPFTKMNDCFPGKEHQWVY